MANKGPDPNRPSASLELRISNKQQELLFAALQHQPQIRLYDGPLPDPFSHLAYLVGNVQGQLVLAAQLKTTDDFSNHFGNSVGSIETLDGLLRKYDTSRQQIFENSAGVVVFRKGEEQGFLIARTEEEIVIQRGGQVGTIHLQSPNDLVTNLNLFNLLLQRYVNAIWRDYQDTKHLQQAVVLQLPQLPEGTLQAWASTYEFVGKEFMESSRPIYFDKDVGGLPEAKEVVFALVLDTLNPEASRRMGTQPFTNKLLLLTGGEGSGKSLVVKALSTKLRDGVDGKVEEFRIPFADVIPKYQSFTAQLLKTLFEHASENEKKKVYTIVHLDNLEHLMRPQQDATYTVDYFSNVIAPILEVIREYSRNFGIHSDYVIVVGESRAPRESLFDAVARSFRRVVDLNRLTSEGRAEVLRIQLAQSRQFASSEGQQCEPFEGGIDARLSDLAKEADGLNGFDIKQAVISLANRKKAQYLESNAYNPATAEELKEALARQRLEKVLGGVQRRGIGFVPR